MKMYTKEELHKIASDYTNSTSSRMEKAVAEAESKTKEFLNMRMYEYASKGLTYLSYNLGALRIIAEKSEGFDESDFIEAIKQKIVPYFTERGFKVEKLPNAPDSYIKISWE